MVLPERQIKPDGQGRLFIAQRRMRAFQRELQAAGVNATVRIERGVEIAAACGQLRTDHLAASAR